MDAFVLNVHSWLRYAVLAAALWTLMRSVMAKGRPWTPADARSLRIFTIVLDIQVLLGLILYFTRGWMPRGDTMAAVMRDSVARFWAVEHIFGMLVAVTLAHIGAVRIRRARTDAHRHTLTLIFVGLALVVIFFSIPWPGMRAGRPLFRLY